MKIVLCGADGGTHDEGFVVVVGHEPLALDDRPCDVALGGGGSGLACGMKCLQVLVEPVGVVNACHDAEVAVICGKGIDGSGDVETCLTAVVAEEQAVHESQLVGRRELGLVNELAEVNACQCLDILGDHMCVGIYPGAVGEQ